MASWRAASRRATSAWTSTSVTRSYESVLRAETVRDRRQRRDIATAREGQRGRVRCRPPHEARARDGGGRDASATLSARMRARGWTHASASAYPSFRLSRSARRFASALSRHVTADLPPAGASARRPTWPERSVSEGPLRGGRIECGRESTHRTSGSGCGTWLLTGAACCKGAEEAAAAQGRSVNELCSSRAIALLARLRQEPNAPVSAELDVRAGEEAAAGAEQAQVGGAGGQQPGGRRRRRRRSVRLRRRTPS